MSIMVLLQADVGGGSKITRGFQVAQAQVEAQQRVVSMRELLEAGVHFGHQTKKWNPKMRPYIFVERNGIHILDLQQTIPAMQAAYEFVAETTSRGQKVLFVGTKKQAATIIEEEATRAGQLYVTNRWLGGTLTNFMTIKARLQYLAQLEARRDRGEFTRLTKAEGLRMEDEIIKLNRVFGGLKQMDRVPAALFIVDPHREELAVTEARKLGLPIIAMVDSNCNPDPIDIVIPANDDAIRGIRLIVSKIADAAIEGQQRRQSRFEGAEAADGER
jgi:small subunit ribosomal protein S2